MDLNKNTEQDMNSVTITNRQSVGPSTNRESQRSNITESLDTIGLRSRYDEEVIIDLNTTMNDEEKQRIEKEKKSTLEKITSTKLEISEAIQTLWMSSFAYAISIALIMGKQTISTLLKIVKLFYLLLAISQIIQLLLQNKSRYKIHQRLNFVVKYTAVSIVLLQVRTVKSLKLNGGPTWYSHAGLILYITASVSVVANHIVGMIKFKETITLRAMLLIIDLFKSISVLLFMLKGINLLDIGWATAMLPTWPLFYIYFGVTILLCCNFLVKLSTILCHKVEKSDLISSAGGFLFLVFNVCSIFILAAIVLDLTDQNPKDNNSKEMSNLAPFCLAASISAGASLFASRRHIPDQVLKMIGLTLKEEEKKKKKEKKVKVNYPLFVKKSKANMFKRAVRDDFKRKQLTLHKESEPDWDKDSKKIETIHGSQKDIFNKNSQRLHSSMFVDDHNTSIKITERDQPVGDDGENMYVMKTINDTEPMSVRARVSYCLTDRKKKPTMNKFKQQMEEKLKKCKHDHGKHDHSKHDHGKHDHSKHEHKKNKKKKSKTSKEVVKKEKDEIDEENLCFICFANEANCVFLDCGHGGICLDCAMDTIKKNNICALCREPVTQIIEINPRVEIRNGLYKVLNSYYVSKEVPGEEDDNEEEKGDGEEQKENNEGNNEPEKEKPAV